MDAKWVFAAAVNGLIAVAAGAFGAHYLNTRLAANDLATFEVAVRYQMYHALALLAVAVAAHSRASNAAMAAGWLFLLGIVLFSGSLFVLSLGGPKWTGPITPLGGLLLIGGWLMLAVHAVGSWRAPTAGT